MTETAWITVGVLFSVGTFVLAAVLVPLVVVRLPADYFVRARPRSRRHLLLRVGRNVLGGALVVLGVAMLVLPGQGLITLLAGLSLLDFPGRRALELRLLRHPLIHGAFSRLRARAGKAPFEL